MYHREPFSATVSPLNGEPGIQNEKPNKQEECDANLFHCPNATTGNFLRPMRGAILCVLLEPTMPQRRSIHIPEGVSSNQRFLAGAFAVAIVVIVGSVMLAKSDKGAIDVSATIMQANIDEGGAGRADGGTPTGAPNVPNVFSSMPNGGLVPQDASGEPPPPPPPPQDTGTTSEEAAPSPEASLNEEGDDTQESVSDTSGTAETENPTENNGNE
jgi:hypothetical protein